MPEKGTLDSHGLVMGPQHPDVTINLVDIPQDIDAKIQAGLQAGGSGYWLRTDMIKGAGLNPDDYMKNMTWTDLTNLGVTVKRP